MAKNQPRFDVEDFERLFRALLPDARPDPFGELFKNLTDQAERFEEEIKATQDYRDGAEEARADIKTRTFGILFLQIFKTLKLFFGFLPQGRVIILVIAVLGLASTLINNKPVTLEGIREAVASTGIADFIDKVLAELKESVGEIATELSDVADVLSVQIAQAAGRFENLEQIFAISQFDAEVVLGFFQELQGQFVPGFEEAGGRAQASLGRLVTTLGTGLGTATIGANAASNIDVFLTPILRNIPAEINKIPDLAGKLVRFA